MQTPAPDKPDRPVRRRASDRAQDQALSNVPKMATISTMFVLITQFAGIVWYVSGEHAAEVELTNRFNRYIEDDAKRGVLVRSAIDAANQTQDVNIARIEANVTRLDTQGGRQLGIVGAQVNSLAEDLRALRTQLAEGKLCR